MQTSENIFPACKERVSAIGDIPERYFTSTSYPQFSGAFLKEFCQFPCVLRLWSCDSSLPLPHHFRVGSADFFRYIYLCPVASFTFIFQYLIWQRIRSHFPLECPSF